jgi:hypothetical protein
VKELHVILARIFFFIAVSIFLFENFNAQGKIEGCAGGGFPDGLCLKAKFGKNFQVGLSQGIVSQINPTAIELYYRLPRKSNSEALRKFYVMFGISSTLFAKGYDTFEKTFLYPRIGRSFAFSKSKKVGLNLDFGITILRTTNPPEGYITEILPFSSSICFFVRI